MGNYTVLGIQGEHEGFSLLIRFNIFSIEGVLSVFDLPAESVNDYTVLVTM